MEILSVSKMRAADQTAISAGISALKLMDGAGKAVADAILARWEKRAVAVLAGPGNNGGDGFVVASLLKKAGWGVTVFLYGDKTALSGEAAICAKRWRAKVQPLASALDVIAGLESADDLLVVDALFGTGLTRPLEDEAKILAELLTVSQAQDNAPIVVAVDVPSGLGGDTGRALGADDRRGGICFHADLTVTFCRPKPAHVLMPGRGVCGEIVVVDIGISDDVVRSVSKRTFINRPDLWGQSFANHEADTHKHARGHVLVLGGAAMIGAARLVAGAARRAGAGLVSIAAPDSVFPIYASSVDPGTLVPSFKGPKGWRNLINDPRKNTCVMGPGAGLGKPLRDMVLSTVALGKRCVLDADALSVFEKDPKALFKAAKEIRKAQGGIDSIVLTPHGGEFPRLFPDLARRYARPEGNKSGAKDSKLAVTREAAKRSGCVVLFKGPDTVVAAPDGRAAVTTNAPRTLATAGSGDVLAGIIGALLAQGMPAFEAANAAAWLHGEAASAFGPGLIAEDIIDELPDVLGWLLEMLP